jgi:F0F1-type ATP synthase membrane subunit a
MEAAPTNDINTTVALSLLLQLLTSTQVSVKGLGYFKRYVSPARFYYQLTF